MNALAIAAQTIKDTISAREVGEAIGLEIRHGRCKCPIHGGTDYNCVLYSGNRGYYCHVCKSGGDVISLVRNYYSEMSYKDCVAWFNDTFHMGLDLESRISPEKRKQAEMALKMRKRANEQKEWVARFRFDLALTADDIVRRLEEIRDEKRPRTYGEWDEDFCMAVELLPAARQFAEDCMMDCMEVKQC